ncbi:DUF397 domain-containing protein [Actinoallomurus acanthiterrae]
MRITRTDREVDEGAVMQRLITDDGWQKSSRSGNEGTSNCVEVRLQDV